MADDESTERPSKRLKLSPSLESEPVKHLQHDLDEPYNDEAIAAAQNQKEAVVGIKAFASEQGDRFTGVLKKRYTDFVVNEILPNGQVLHLTSTTVPEKFRTKGKTNKKGTQNGTDDIGGVKPVQEEEPSKISVPADAKSEDANGGSNDVASKQEDSPRISEADKQQLITYLNAHAVSELLSLYQSLIKYPLRKPKEHPFVRTEFTTDRSIRAEIHGCIRRVFSSRIESNTDNDGYLILTAAQPNSRSNRPRNEDSQPKWRPGKTGWAERGGEYLHFTLYKENKDTMEAVSYLVRQMKINAKVFQFAGTKDRRAATTQRISAHRIDMERLANQNRSLRAACVGDFEYQPHGLELGDLGGNEFTLTLRDCNFVGATDLSLEQSVQHVRDVIERGMTDLHEKGYLNYYGLQRFGTFAARTDMVGEHILQGNFKSAVEAILEFDASVIPPNIASAIYSTEAYVLRQEYSEDTSRAIAISLYKRTTNLHKTLELLPRKCTAETSLLRHLHRQPLDYYGALMTITRNLRLMYVHAYQSLVWNNAATYRMNTYGSRIVEGDLVLASEHKDKIQLASQSATETGTETAEVDADGEIIVNPEAHDRSNNIDDLFERARPLTSAEASSGQYTIFDIVLPLPGYDVLYPTNSTGDFYKTFMAENGNLDPHDMRRKHRDFSLSGSYRKIMSRIGNGWSADVRTYKRDEEQFVQTDLEKMKEVSASGTGNDQDQHRSVTFNQNQTKQGDQDTQNGQPQSSNEMLVDAPTQTPSEADQPVQNPTTSTDEATQKREEPPTKLAVVLKFQLGASQYATMALRELSRGGITAYQAEFSGKKDRNRT